MLTKYQWSGKQFDLTTEEISITSDNFSVDENGNIQATGGTIGDFTIDNTSLKKDLSGIYDYSYFDLILVAMSIMGNITLDSNMIQILDFNNSGTITPADYVYIRNVLRDTQENTKEAEGKFEINAEDIKNCLVIKNASNEIITSIGLGGINSNFITANQLVIGEPAENYNDAKFVAVDGTTGNLKATGEVHASNITQTSLESIKKNIKESNINALELIKRAKIYEYNLKAEKDEDKKHIGFVIGDKYETPKEVISQSGEGIDTYTMTSIMWKSIQEQQKIIEDLQKEIKLLKGEKDG